MAETPSSSLKTTAAQLREAAKQTMRRKQALAARQAVPTIRNATKAPSSNQFSSIPSSAGLASAKLPPMGPHGPNPLHTRRHHGLMDVGVEKAAIAISKNKDDDDELSPKTAQMNQHVSARLLETGVDEYHCRPNLPMTFQQFDDAKRLILDLLGFGMTPEDIADIGINRRLLIYCLRELKIRLPANVPTDDIISFGPPPEIVPDDPMEGSQLPSATQSPQTAKRSARLNGGTNRPALKRSDLALASPERRVITSREGVELLPSTLWNEPRDYSGVNGARDSEVSQLAAAAVAFGLVTAEELEASRLQDEERAAQLKAKVEKVLQIRVNLKLLELKKAENKLLTLQSMEDESAALHVQKEVETLGQELESIQAQLRSLPPQAENPRREMHINSDRDLTMEVLAKPPPSRNSVDMARRRQWIVFRPSPPGSETSPPQEDEDLLTRLDSEKRLLLRQKLLQLKEEGRLTSSMPEGRISTPSPLSSEFSVLHAEIQLKPSIFGEERVRSPSPMEVLPEQSSSHNRNHSFGLGISLPIRAPKRKRKRKNQYKPLKEGDSGSGSGSGELTYSESRCSSVGSMRSDLDVRGRDSQSGSPRHSPNENGMPRASLHEWLSGAKRKLFKRKRE